MNTHLYLIQSPLQAVNAFEARHTIADGDARHLMVVLDQKESLNNLILGNTLRLLGWDVWRTVPFHPGNAARTWDWILLRTALRKLGGASRVYIGNYAAGMAVAAANIFPNAEHFLLDDGTSSINFPSFRYEGRRPEHLPPAKNVPVLRYNTALPPTVTFFSMYELALRPPDTLRMNRLSFLKNALHFDPAGPVFFIGSCLPDVDVITFDQFFGLLRAARCWFGDREIVYFPHRRELLDRKQVLFRELGVRLADPNLPFELGLVHGAEKPSAIATFYSTALDTLKIMGTGTRDKLFAFHVPEQWIQTQAHREIARLSYVSYRQSAEITVVDDYVSPQ